MTSKLPTDIVMLANDGGVMIVETVVPEQGPPKVQQMQVNDEMMLQSCIADVDKLVQSFNWD